MARVILLFAVVLYGFHSLREQILAVKRGLLQHFQALRRESIAVRAECLDVGDLLCFLSSRY